MKNRRKRGIIILMLWRKSGLSTGLLVTWTTPSEALAGPKLGFKSLPDLDGDGLHDAEEDYGWMVKRDLNGDGDTDDVISFSGVTYYKETLLPWGQGGEIWSARDDPDSDNDGLTDLQEKEHYTHPMFGDTDHDGLADSLDTMNPLTDLKITFTIKEILQLDPVDDRSGSDTDNDNTAGDFYVKIRMDASGEITWKNTAIPIEKDNADVTAVQKVVFPVSDDIEEVTFTVYLYDDDSGTGELCDISPSSDYYATLHYSLKNSTWWGDDYVGDSNNYGTMSGNEDGSATADENDCAIEFNIQMNDVDGDGLAYWEEMNVYNSNPINYTRNWLFMIYMDGDNNIEHWAIEDLNEMEAVGSSDLFTIVVQLDRWDGYHDGKYGSFTTTLEDDVSNGNWTGTRRYYITKDNDPNIINSKLISDIGEVNMADSNTLEEFVIWAETNYQKTNTYALDLWDHGAGWVRICKDEESGNDNLTMIELKEAMNAIKTEMGQNIDVILMNACMMQMAEVAYQLKDTADVMIGSEETIPGLSLPYDQILADLRSTPQLTTNNFASIVVNDYINYYNSSWETDRRVTLSAISLRNFPSIASAINSFSQELLTKVDQWTQEITEARNSTESYSFITSYRDIYDFALKIKSSVDDPQIQNSAQGVMDAIDNAIISEGHLVLHPNSHGLTIYWPEKADYSVSYEDLDFAVDTSWDEFLQAYYMANGGA